MAVVAPTHEEGARWEGHGQNQHGEGKNKMTIRSVQISDGRTIAIDLPLLDEGQQVALATGIADFLIRSGQINTDVAINPIQMIQFLSEAADQVAPEREMTFQGKIADFGMTCGTHGIDVSVIEPYDHVVSITIEPAKHQSVESMRSATAPLSTFQKQGKTVLVTARLKDGNLTCHSHDITIV